jgi:soluble lytic murein transglycosylase-like protein
MKEMIKEYPEKQAKRFPFAWCILFIFVAMIGLRLTYGLAVLGIPSNVVYATAPGQNATGRSEAAKQAILQLMKEHSDMPEQVLSNIYHAAARTGNRDLVLAICLVESNFNPKVESNKGAIGLMGIMPGVWLGELRAAGIIREKEDLYKVSNNIAAGAYVLARYLSETTDLRQALRRYVGGASWYASRVMKAQEKIELAQLSGQQLALEIGQD